MSHVITIDGPAASGKSTVARLMAQALGWHHLNSGLLYRGLAYALMEHGGYTVAMFANLKPEDVAIYLVPEKFEYVSVNGVAKLLIDSVDVTPLLKNSVMDSAASVVSTNFAVRAALLDFQRDLARRYNFVVDGRDSGSVVFPHADVKFYLTAPLKVRAARWQAMQAKQGSTITLEQASTQIQERDKRDIERIIAPLVIPEGAIVVDNAELNPQQTLDWMLSLMIGQD